MRLPESITDIFVRLRNRRVFNKSVNSSAVSEKISALLTEEYIEARAKRADIKKVEQILANVPDRDPASEDLR